MMIGQRVVINHSSFIGVTGIIIDTPVQCNIYYRVKYDQKMHGFGNGLFTEKELKLLDSENILEYIKFRLTGGL